MTLIGYNLMQKVNKTILFNAVAELLYLDSSQIMCVNTGQQCSNTKVVILYRESDDTDDYTALAEINSYETVYEDPQFYELDFGIKLARKINADLFVSAPLSSPYDTIKITPKGSIYNCIEDFYEDENGKESIRIINLDKFSKKEIIKLKKEYKEATIKELEELKNRKNK